jgi:integrase
MNSRQTLWNVCHDYYFRKNPDIRSELTRRQYRFALKDLAAALGKTPTLGDLTDDSVSDMLAYLQAKPVAPKTANERAGRIIALWRFLAERRKVNTWPQPQQLPVPRKTPLAWMRGELDSLLAACGRQTGFVAGVPASWWWVSLHLVMWDSGERIGALMQCRWEWLADNWLTIPAEVRKGQVEDRVYQLSRQAVDALEVIRRPKRTLIWPWDKDRSSIWRAYKVLRSAAGLATDRRSSFHRMRRSVASHFEAAGGNATELLGHSDRRLTKLSYLDPRIVKTSQAADKLFRLEPPKPSA